MTGKTHMTARVLTGITISAINQFGFERTVACCAIAAIAALVPDVDLVTSKAGKAIKPVSFIINKFFGHRTLFHAPLIYITIYGFLIKYCLPYIFYINIAYIGIASHLFLDIFGRHTVVLSVFQKKISSGIDKN